MYTQADTQCHEKASRKYKHYALTSLSHVLVSRKPRFGSPFSSKVAVIYGLFVILSLTIKDTLKWLSSPPILMQESFWW